MESACDNKSSVVSSRAFFAPRIRCVHLLQIVAQLFGGQIVVLPKFKEKKTQSITNLDEKKGVIITDASYFGWARKKELLSKKDPSSLDDHGPERKLFDFKLTEDESRTNLEALLE